MKFRRKGSEDTAQEGSEDTAQEGTESESPFQTAEETDPVDEVAAEGRRGPWDAADVDDSINRLDFGALRVPAVDGMEVRLDVDDQGTVASVAVSLDETVLQLQAFAAPRTEGLWDEVRVEMLEGISETGVTANPVDGPFGPELRADLPVEGPDGKPQGLQPVRFLGVDGPRWFLRAVITGPGAADAGRAQAVHELLRQVVVDRGGDAAPPRELLPLQVPDDPALQPGAKSQD